MKPEPTGWSKLVGAARAMRDDRDVSAPYGFATRVAALAFAAERKVSLGALFDRFAWRALAIAGLLAGLSAVSSHGLASAQDEDDAYADDAAEMLVQGLSGS